MSLAHHLKVLSVVAIAVAVSGVACQKETKKETKEAYRQVTAEDGIRFYSRAHMVTSSGGNLHEEGFECFVVGDDGKNIEIALVSAAVDNGDIKTKNFGILHEEMGSNLVGTLFATESQIKKLRELQSSGRSLTGSR